MMRDKGKRLPPFVPLYKHMIGHPAWHALSHGARSLYTALKSRYNTNQERAVYLSTRVAAKELGSHRDQISRWFRELEHYGFIVMVTSAHLGVEGRGKAPHWRLTADWFAGQAPTRDWEKWDGSPFRDQKSMGHYVRKHQNPGPENRSTVARKSGPLLALKSGPPTPATGPEIRSIEAAPSDPEIRSITTLATPTLAEGEASGARVKVAAVIEKPAVRPRHKGQAS